MLSSSKKILVEYRSLVVRMVHDNVAIQTTKPNYELLCDVKTFLGLVCIMRYWKQCKDDQSLRKGGKL